MIPGSITVHTVYQPQFAGVVATGYVTIDPEGDLCTCVVQIQAAGGSWSRALRRREALELAVTVVGRWLWERHRVIPRPPVVY